MCCRRSASPLGSFTASTRESRSTNSRYLAERIPGAELVELTGKDHAPWVDPDQIVEPIGEFLHRVWDERAWEATEIDRVLATVLFTDIVGSTEKAVELGDREWHELVERHHGRRAVAARSASAAARWTRRATGSSRRSTGPPGRSSAPARSRAPSATSASTSAPACTRARSSWPTSEPRGIAVHIGARVSARAEPGEVLVSNTVKDLVAGSGIEFDERGTAELKGVPGEWRLYAVRN